MMEPERSSRETRSAKGCAILCVDDEPRVLDALRRALRFEPYEILSAQNAEEALKVLERHPVRVVLSDERMAGMSGSEFLYQVREIRPGIGRILLTGHPGPEVMVRSLVAGADVLMSKPWDEGALKRLIRSLLVEGVQAP